MKDKKKSRKMSGVPGELESASMIGAELAMRIETPRDRKRNRKKRKSHTFLRLTLIVVLAVVFLAFDVGVLIAWNFREPAKVVAPSSDPIGLIKRQLETGAGENIPVVGFDTNLMFAKLDGITIVSTSKLTPIENNFYKVSSNPLGSDLLYDEMIVNRVIRFNSEWISYVNKGDQKIFTSIASGGKAESKIKELGAGAKLDYFRLAIGEIQYTGKSYYVVAQINYGLTVSSQLKIYNDVFVYELVAKDDTMLVKDFEQVVSSGIPSG